MHLKNLKAMLLYNSSSCTILVCKSGILIDKQASWLRPMGEFADKISEEDVGLLVAKFSKKSGPRGT